MANAVVAEDDSLASSVDEEPADFEQLYDSDAGSSEDEGFDRFADLATAKNDMSYRGHTVHFWTVPFSAVAGRKTAENPTRVQMMRVFRKIYGGALAFYAVFKEFHAASPKCWERKAHYHLVLKLERRVRWKRLAAELRSAGIFGHLAIPRRNADIWRVLAYCYVPSPRKSISELDSDPLFSSKFPMAEMEKKLRVKLQKTQLRPSDFFEVVRRRPELETFSDLISWAQDMRSRGVHQYQDFMARHGSRKFPLGGCQSNVFLFWNSADV